jgi:hypothetical protein
LPVAAETACCGVISLSEASSAIWRSIPSEITPLPVGVSVAISTRLKAPPSSAPSTIWIAERRLPAWAICKAIPSPSAMRRAFSSAVRAVGPPLTCPAICGRIASTSALIFAWLPGIEPPPVCDMTVSPASLAA